MRRTMTVVRGLALACHPAPTVTVTTAVTALVVAGGASGSAVVVVLLAVLTGQLSVGWSNDALDAPRDLAVRRVGKPIVAGLVTRAVVATTAGVALVVSVLLSFVVAGVAGGACHVVFLASAWAYNLGLKRTRLSLVPYAIGFGALPGFVTYALDPPRAPAPWALVAGGLLGVAAGLANAAPDVEDDRATGVHGAVGRIGAQRARVACVVVVIAATVVVVLGAGLSTGASVVALAVTLLLGAGGLVVGQGRLLFPAVLLIALADVALLVTHTSTL